MTTSAGGAEATGADRSDLAALAAVVSALRADLVACSVRHADEIARVHAAHRADAENLLHYLEFRGHDLRSLQARLTDLGLSSLGRSEGHVLATVDAVLTALRALDGKGPQAPDSEAGPGEVLTFARGRHLLAANTEALLGTPPASRSTMIMVTLPESAAADYPLVRTLVERGMNCARVNCAHDGPAAWSAMIDHVRRASAQTGRPCLVAMDLAGPKLRTGPLAAGPRIVRLRPKRDAYGRVITPATAWLVDEATDSGDPGGGTTVPVPGVFLAALRAGDRVHLRDTRGAARYLRVVEVSPVGVRAEAGRTTYLATGTTLRAEQGYGAEGTTVSAQVGDLPPLEQALRLREGDELVVTRDLTPVDPPAPGETARIGCTLPEVFDQARAGQHLWFDDGKIGAVVAQAGAGELRVRITEAGPSGARLRGAKGINLPDTDLPVSALTDKDEADLAFVAAHADLVSLSFVRHRSDVARLRELLAAADREDIGVILKIETRQAFENLPQLLLTAMRGRRVGVMIARGDLAVEAGYERLAELQEEILWLCEAAHVPVVWATQVLDQLARTGRPTRAEITDAAMAERAECVLLNKGPYIAEAVTVLDDVLTRMADHQRKKVQLLRPLRSWSARA